MLNVTLVVSLTKTSMEGAARLVQVVTNTLLAINAISGRTLVITDDPIVARKIGNRDWQSSREHVLLITPNPNECRTKFQDISRTTITSAEQIETAVRALAITDAGCYSLIR